MGDLALATQAAPATPSAGYGVFYFDSTSKRGCTIDDAGAIRVLVDRGSTETLAAKSFDDTCKFIGSADATKVVALSIGGMTAAKTLTLTFVQTTTQPLTFPDIRQAETVAIKPQILQSTPADPTGTASTTGVMMGLAAAITPQVTGRLAIFISGNLTNSTAAAGDGAKAQIRHGTGAAPANAAALTGTADGNIVSSVLERATANDLQAFACHAIITGLAVGTAVWIDISLAAIVGGTALAKNVSITGFEL